MGKESSERLQTSILNRMEKKVLVWLAQRQPKWITSDALTYIGMVGAALVVVGGLLSQRNLNYLWLASLGLMINWYGDSLDGTLARVRQTQRPVYGFFIDHTLDAIATCLICIGLGLSPMLRLDVALFIMGGYLCLSIYTYVGAIIAGKFRLTYGKLGPTEVRIMLIMLNTLFIYTPWKNVRLAFFGQEWGVFDVVGCVIIIILYALYFIQFVNDKKELAKQDPLKPYNGEA